MLYEAKIWCLLLEIALHSAFKAVTLQKNYWAQLQPMHGATQVNLKEKSFKNWGLRSFLAQI